MKYKISLFFIIGLLLYVIDMGLNSYDEKEIYISDQEIISLVSAWKSQVGRNPTDDEIVRIKTSLKPCSTTSLKPCSFKHGWFQN